jgi:hypothetical protein
MTADQVLVRCLRGQAGPTCPEDGYLVRLAADLADELLASGEAVAVAAEGYAGQNFTDRSRETALVLASRVGRI